VRSNGIDVVPIGVKAAAPRIYEGFFAFFGAAKGRKTLGETAELNPRPQVILRSLFGALLSNLLLERSKDLGRDEQRIDCMNGLGRLNGS
jgi:hypothetical protein